jgi:hypothetical protein
MVIGKPLSFVRAFVEAVDKAIAAHSPGQCLSTLQGAWLAFCITAILVTNSICWARFERASLGTYSLAALSWMFRHAKIPWEHLLVASVRVMLESYGITGGSLVIDDTDKRRSKTATTLAHLYKLRDKESGGYIWGQSLVFLLLVTPTITIPMGFAFYQPAPELSAWYKEDKRRKQQGVPKQQRPPKPPPNPTYPTKHELALRLLRQCKAHHPTLRVHCIVADALYGASTFVDAASDLGGGVQVISQLRSNQKVRVYKREQSVADYFTTHPGTPPEDSHPWWRRDRGPGGQCSYVCLCPPHETLYHCAEIRGRGQFSLSDGLGPHLAHARHRPGAYFAVARGGFCAGLEVA